MTKERLDEAITLLIAALLEIEAAGWHEGVSFGPDKEIDTKIRSYLLRFNIDPPEYPASIT